MDYIQNPTELKETKGIGIRNCQRSTSLISDLIYNIYIYLSIYKHIDKLYTFEVYATTELPNNNKQLDITTSITKTNYHLDLLDKKNTQHTLPCQYKSKNNSRNQCIRILGSHPHFPPTNSNQKPDLFVAHRDRCHFWTSLGTSMIRWATSRCKSQGVIILPYPKQCSTTLQGN